MDKLAIIEKLQGLGIHSENCYPKSSFPKGGDIMIGLFKREMKEDFYFFNTYDKKIYKLPQVKDISKYEEDDFKGQIKMLVPLIDCLVIWEDKPFIEKEDIPFSQMTLRQYICIKYKIPDTGVEWVDTLIKEAKYEEGRMGEY